MTYVSSKILKKEAISKIDIFVIVSLLFFGIFSLSAVYGGEAPVRGFMFGLPLLSYVAISSFKNNKKLIVLILVSLIFLHMPADYADNSYRTVTSTELAGAKFFSEHSNVTSCSYSFPSYVRYFSPDITTIFITLTEQPFTSAPDIKKLTGTECILYSALQVNYYTFYIGYNPIDKLYLENKFRSLYNNGRFIYFDNGKIQ